MPKRIFEKISLPARIGISVGAGAAFAVVCCLIFAFVAKCSADPAKNLTLYGEISFLTAMLFCGFFSAKIGDERKMFEGIISGAAMLALVVLPSLLVNTGGFLKALIVALLGMFVCTVGAALGSREPKRKRRR